MFYLQLWERRSKFVNESEREKWGDIEPSMLSDEESLADGTIARRRPIWRSQELNELIDELDDRANAHIKNARKQRILLSPWKTNPPKDCKPWMIHTEES